MRRAVIGFTGPIGCGKTTAASVLENKGWVRVRFAGPLKAMMGALGCTAEEIDGVLKETPCDLLGGKTPRYAMQTLGTEWGRQMIAPDLWIKAWRRIFDSLPLDVHVVADDVRFQNEADAIHAVGGTVVGIIRDGHVANKAHASEAFEFKPDSQIVNGGLLTFKFDIEVIGNVWERMAGDDAA